MLELKQHYKTELFDKVLLAVIGANNFNKEELVDLAFGDPVQGTTWAEGCIKATKNILDRREDLLNPVVTPDNIVDLLTQPPKHFYKIEPLESSGLLMGDCITYVCHYLDNISAEPASIEIRFYVDFKELEIWRTEAINKTLERYVMLPYGPGGARANQVLTLVKDTANL